MPVKISDEVRDGFPRQYVAVFGPTRVRAPVASMIVVAKMRQRCEDMRDEWNRVSPPEIIHWREMFRQMRAKSGARASVDTLLRRFLRDGALPPVHPLVDLCNWISLANLVPMAAYDADFVSAHLQLRHGIPGELFEPLGSPGTHEAVTSSEVVYADNDGVICRYWNWRDCHRTRIRAGTGTAIFFADLTADTTNEAMRRAGEIAHSLNKALNTNLDVEIY